MDNIVTVAELAKYSGVYADENAEEQELYISAAFDILCSYLGYDPRKQEYTRFYRGKNSSEIRVGTKPIAEIKEIKIDGVPFHLEQFAFNDDSVFFTSMGEFSSKNVVQLTFVAGWEREEIPAIMKMTVLRIATLLQLESDSNIGVNSRSFGDSTRTFLNTTNYDKYLIQCSRYKLLF